MRSSHFADAVLLEAEANIHTSDDYFVHIIY